MTVRLVIFDVDGTLVDSQHDIVESFSSAFQSVGLDVPERSKLLGVVGLSLPQIMLRLAPNQSDATREQIISAYKTKYHDLRMKNGSSPFYAGAQDALQALNAKPDVLLGVATGKSRRGLDALISGHELDGMFVTTQVSDNHPSKPHPSMLFSALSDCGVEARDAVMIGDTQYDMEMARAAQVPFIGVSWGYHSAHILSDAVSILGTFSDLLPALETHWETAP